MTDLPSTGFTFETTPRIICEDGAAALNAGALDGALASLREAGVAVATFAEVLPDPPEHCVEAAAAAARAHGADGVIGFGGGSSMDTAKLAALLARPGRDGAGETLAAVYGVGRARGPRLALIQVPTTAGTGSEVTPIAIVTTPAHEKQGVVAGALYADLAVLDATLTVALPPSPPRSAA